MMLKTLVRCLAFAAFASACSGGPQPELTADTTTPATSSSVASSVSTVSSASTVSAVSTSSSVSVVSTSVAAGSELSPFNFDISLLEAEGVRPIACTQTDRALVQVDPPFGVGATRQLVSVTHKAGDGFDGFLTKRIEFAVIEETETGVSLEWSTDGNLLNIEMPVGADVATTRLVESVPREVLRYEIDNDGSFGSVLNLADIRRDAIKSVDLLQALGQDQATVEGLRALYEGLRDNELEAVFAAGPKTYHSLGGTEFVKNETVHFETELANPFGAEPLAARVFFELLASVDDDGCALVEVLILPDPEAFLDRTSESLMNAGLIDKPLGFDDVDRWHVELRTVAQLDPSSGFVRRIESTNRVIADGKTVTRTTVIIDVTPG